jgi:uncharacterized lipoprotein YmbA
MNSPHILRLRALGRRAAVGLLAALAGCTVFPPAQEDSTRFFVLSDVAVPEAGAGLATAEGGLRIGLRPVRLEGYLKDRPMVVRTGPNELRFEDFRQWAEPLDTAIGRIVRSKLLAYPAVAQVYAEPFPFDQARDFDVSIDVTRFEGAVSANGKYVASLTAVIEISTPGANARVVSRKVFTAPAEDWDGRDFGGLANLLSGDVAALAQEVAADLPTKH